MTNAQIADNFSLLSKLIDIHDADSFKSKTYASAAFAIESLPSEISELPIEKIFTIRGIGKSVGEKVVEQLQTQNLQALQEYLAKTPAGILEMLQNIKGLGPKKIAIVWKEMQIENIAELLYACNENRLTLYKGFGEKSQASIRESIEFYLGTLGNYLYAQVEQYAQAFCIGLQNGFSNEKTELTGAFLRQEDVLNKIEFTTTILATNLKKLLLPNGYTVNEESEGEICFIGNENILLQFYIATKENFVTTHFIKSCTNEFLENFIEANQFNITENFVSEVDLFAKYNVQFIKPYQRANPIFIGLSKSKVIPKSIEFLDVKGIIHSHSTWSDGSHTLKQMATAAKEKGFEYLVISDHSKTAFYAQGLSVEKVISQHDEIDFLNKQLGNFKIFKSIESDILGDGSLDYENDILNLFDIVIASIHSNLSMTEDKAMQRLIKAIENPYTSILGHCTGRLLLGRNGYPINHKKIIEACAANNVAIELNAHPRRLDIDWKFIDYAISKNVLISINPDAHAIEGFDDCRYGVLAAQKSTLTKEQNLSSYNLLAFEEFVKSQKLKR